MKFSLKAFIFCAALAAGSAPFGQAANAVTYSFTLAGQDNYSWVLDSNPVPDVINAQYFYIAGVGPGVGSQSGLSFYVSGLGGGLATGDDSGGLFNLSGLQLFSGTTTAPQFLTGTYNLTNYPSEAPIVDTLTISAVSETPLPATLPLFASALGGFGLLAWRRKKKTATLATA